MRSSAPATGWNAARALGVLAVLGAPCVARAEPTAEQKAAATVLFREARGLMEKGDVAAACRRFEESERLDPLAGTQLNMAVCHEREGRTATAWVEFRDAAALARRDARDDRIALAEGHMKDLEPRLTKVRIVVGPGADVPQLAVKLDGSDLARPAWDTPLPVDPGAHIVAASAPGKKAFEAKVQADREGETRVVAIDTLEDAPAPPVMESVPPSPVLSVHANRDREPPFLPAADEGLSSRRISALVLGGAAIAGVGVGTAFGVDAISKHAASNRACTGNQCTGPGLLANRESQTSADVSTVAFSIALPALAVATYLWLSGGHATQASALRVIPAVSPGGGGLTVGRAF